MTDSASNTVRAIAVSGTSIFVGTGGDGVYVSTDNGESWHWENAGLTNGNVSSLVVSDNYLIAGIDAITSTGEGEVWRRPLSALLSVDAHGIDIPSVFSLDQNNPNPFNPSTTIRYALPNRAHFTLTVLSTLGQHIATLVNEIQEAGYHDVRFDGSGLASGVYFYRLKAGDFIQTKQLLILR